MRWVIDTPIYVNKNLILDLYSILVDGYIDSKDIKFVKDEDINFKIQNGCKNGKSKEKKKTNNNKDNNILRDRTISDSQDRLGSLEDKNNFRNEIHTKRIYTTFQIFNTTRDIMKKYNMVKVIKGINSIEHNFAVGEYIEFEGIVSAISIQSQINTVINIFEAYDTKILDKLIKVNQGEEPLTNYSVLLKQLKNLSDQLSRNNTVTMVLENNFFKAVLNVNLNNFLDKTAYIYDDVHCNSKVLCKVIKIAKEEECIDLFDKTAMSEYYNKLIEQTKEYLKLLSQNGIIVSEEFSNKIKGPAIQVVPIAMYI